MPTYPQYKRVPLIFFLDEVLRTGKIRKMEDVSVMFYDEPLGLTAGFGVSFW